MSKAEKKDKKKKIVAVVLTIVILFVILYLIMTVFYQNRFFNGTKINGLDCSGKTVSQVETMINDEIRLYVLKLYERNDKSENFASADIDMKITIDGDIEELLKKQNSYAWIFSNNTDNEIKTTITYDESKLDEAINKLNCMDSDKITTKTEPTVVYEDNVYKVDKGDKGTEIDSDKLKAGIKDAVDKKLYSFNLEEEGIYKVNELSPTDNLVELANTLNTYVSVTINYKFGDETVTCNRDIINTWLFINNAGEIGFDKAKVTEFVQELADKYDTVGKARTFKTSYNQDVNIVGGTYGYKINLNKEVTSLIEAIKTGVSTTREPEYSNKGVERGKNDIGTTYIEVNLLKQHLFYYKDGNLAFECDIVSGKSLSTTPTGTYAISSLKKNTTININNAATAVSYCMSFDTDKTTLTINDAAWIPTFGASIYTASGSEGSIFMSVDSAKELYGQISVPTPLIIYQLLVK